LKLYEKKFWVPPWEVEYILSTSLNCFSSRSLFWDLAGSHQNNLNKQIQSDSLDKKKSTSYHKECSQHTSGYVLT